MHTNFTPREHAPRKSNDGLHLLLYAVASALLPYAAAAALLLIGQGA